MRYLTAATHPDHETICTFRRKNKAAISAAFVEILQLAKELGILKVGKASVDADGSHLVVGTHIAAVGNDKNELPAAYEAIPEEVGKPTAMIADAGYNTAEHLEAQEDKTDLYVSVHREDAPKEREYDFRPKRLFKAKNAI